MKIIDLKNGLSDDLEKVWERIRICQKFEFKNQLDILTEKAVLLQSIIFQLGLINSSGDKEKPDFEVIDNRLDSAHEALIEAKRQRDVSICENIKLNTTLEEFEKEAKKDSEVMKEKNRVIRALKQENAAQLSLIGAHQEGKHDPSHIKDAFIYIPLDVHKFNIESGTQSLERIEKLEKKNSELVSKIDELEKEVDSLKTINGDLNQKVYNYKQTYKDFDEQCKKNKKLKREKQLLFDIIIELASKKNDNKDIDIDWMSSREDS